MRPHRALFHLVLRHTVWKVLLLLLLLAAAQWSAFLCLSPDPASIGLADAFSLSGGALAGLLALAFLLLSALLLLATTGRGARRPGYTLARLPLSPGWVVFWQGVYNTLVYLLFWGVQALVLVGIGWYYAGKEVSWARKPSMSPSGNWTSFTSSSPWTCPAGG